MRPNEPKEPIIVTALDAVVMLTHVMEGAAHKDVGFLDSERTLEQLRLALNQPVRVDKEVMESALYSCSLMDEHGEFRHPDGLNFGAFIKKLLGGKSYDRFFSFIGDKN